MRILVTGATGKIGAPVVHRLLRSGTCEVRILSRRSPASLDPGVECLLGDLLQPASLAPALGGVEVVLHAAACTHAVRAARYQRVNVGGTANLVAAAEAAGVRRFVFVSTRAVGERGGAYSASKERAERIVRGSRLSWVILRPGEVYGGGGRDPIRDLVDTLRTRRFVLILGRGAMELSPVFLDDVVEAVARATLREQGSREVFTLAGPESLTQLELVRRIEACLGGPRRLRVHVPVPFARAAIAVTSRLGLGSYVPDQVPRLALEKATDVGSAERELGFHPRRLEQGLRMLLGGAEESR